MKKFSLLIIGLYLFAYACTPSECPHCDTENASIEKITLDTVKAEYLYHFAFKCIDKEYPNKLSQVLGDESYLKTPAELHPCFYGCFDWHSAVHGHWTLVNILRAFPDFKHFDAVMAKLKANITPAHVQVELKYWDDKYNKTFERTYGWVWLLKLSESLREWNHPEAKKMAKDLEPMVKMVEKKLMDFLPKLTYPIRTGMHGNTAFALSFALDYAEKYNPELAALIKKRAKEYYLNDVNAPLRWEPSGFDFLSPCLQEAALMNKVLGKEDFVVWLDKFLPDFRVRPDLYLLPAVVSDRSDGHIAHLDGLNFSRAWCLYEIGNALKNNNMLELANLHFNTSYRKMGSGEYAGEHWLASFALYALLAQ